MNLSLRRLTPRHRHHLDTVRLANCLAKPNHKVRNISTASLQQHSTIPTTCCTTIHNKIEQVDLGQNDHHATMKIEVDVILRGVYSDTTQLNSTELSWTQLDVELSTRSQREQLSPINERSDPVDSICRSWRHKQKHDWLGCTLFNRVSWVQLSWVELCRYKHPFKLHGEVSMTKEMQDGWQWTTSFDRCPNTSAINHQRPVPVEFHSVILSARNSVCLHCQWHPTL